MHQPTLSRLIPTALFAFAAIVGQLRAADLSSRLTNWAAWGAGDTGQTGEPHFGQSIVPSLTFQVSDIAAGGNHNAALKTDGTVYCWGRNDVGQCDVPAGLIGVRQVTAGHLHTMALLTDGSLVHWGSAAYEMRPIPPDVTNLFAIASGYSHCLALRNDGKVLAWGYNGWGQTDVPTGLSNVVKIAAGGAISAVVRNDGTVITWGIIGSQPPVGLGPVRDVACGNTHFVALLRNGTVAAWGNDASGTAVVVPQGLSNVVQVAAGVGSSLALKSDGTLVVWGEGEEPNGQTFGQTVIPQSLGPVRRVRAGHLHAIAERGNPESLVGYYPLDGSGMNLSSGEAEDIAVAAGGGSFGKDRYGIDDGSLNIARSLGFGGVIHGLTMPNPNYTVSVWVRLPMLGDIPIQSGTRILDQSWPAGNFVLGLNPDGTVYFMTADAQAYPVIRPKLGEWHHVACVFNHSVLRLYIDGVLVAVDLATRANAESSYDLYLGTNDQNIPFTGQIDDLRIYSIGLSTAEVQALYDRERKPPNPRTAKATGEVVKGFLVSSTVTDGGFGYTNSPVVTISSGGGTGATAVALIGANGTVTGITITDAGIGYTSTPTITIAPPPTPLRRATGFATVNNGVVTEVTVTDPGYGYSEVPTVLLVGGGGAGATAVATVANGLVTGISIVSTGSGYTDVPVARIASPPFSPYLNIATSKVKVTQNVVLGRRYLLESSKDLLSWSAVGIPFLADDESITAELDVLEMGQFFRISQVP